jgi:hypothetical protein
MSMAVPVLPPPLRDGDRLTREEFLRRWEAMPDLKHAELIDGIVHMPSPLSRPHGLFQPFVSAWLFHYAQATKGCETGAEATWVMDANNIPQPDLCLCIQSEYGGQSRVVQDLYSGAPELLVEISHSSSSRDLGAKSDLYLRCGVREYLVVLTRKPEVVWREAARGRFRRIAADADGLLRSRVFPGLWMDPAALLNRDWSRTLDALTQGLGTPEHAAFVERLAARRA